MALCVFVWALKNFCLRQLCFVYLMIGSLSCLLIDCNLASTISSYSQSLSSQGISDWRSILLVFALYWLFYVMHQSIAYGNSPSSWYDSLSIIFFLVEGLSSNDLSSQELTLFTFLMECLYEARWKILFQFFQYSNHLLHFCFDFLD